MTWVPPSSIDDCDDNPKIPCALHTDHDVIAACETCDDRLICTTCMNSTCYGHTLCTLEEIADRKIKQLCSLTREVETLKLPKLQVKMNQVQRKREVLLLHCDEIREKICKRAEEMKKQIDIICEKCVKECNEFLKRKDELLKTFEENIAENLSELRTSLSKVKKIINSGHFRDILASDEIKNYLEKFQLNTCVPVVSVIWFVPTQEKIKVLEALYGEMKRSVVVNEFEHISDEIRTLAVVGEQAWISCDSKKELYLTNKEGDVVQSIKLRNYFLNHIMDICPGQDDSLWAMCRDGIVSQILPHNVKVDQFYIGKHSTAYSLYVFSNRDIVIGLVEGVLRLKGKVVRYNSDGRVLDRAVWNNDGKLMFSVPQRVRGCDESGDIAVVNHDNKGDNSIIILDAEFKFKLTFKGPTPFQPSDACFDSGQNILISDRASKSVILLDSHGRVCRKLLIAKVSPSAIGMQGNGNLWTGFVNGAVKIYKYTP